MLKRDVPKSIQKEDGASYELNFMTGIVNELTVQPNAIGKGASRIHDAAFQSIMMTDADIRKDR